jgi:hypothetical protein
MSRIVTVILIYHRHESINLKANCDIELFVMKLLCRRLYQNSLGLNSLATKIIPSVYVRIQLLPDSSTGRHANSLSVATRNKVANG